MIADRAARIVTALLAVLHIDPPYRVDRYLEDLLRDELADIERQAAADREVDRNA